MIRSPSHIYQVGVGVSSFEIDLFGRVRSLTHAALEQYLAQEQARRSAQLSLIAEVANAYLTLASDRELQRLAQQTLKSQEHSYRADRRSATTPARSPALDLAQAQTTVESARADAARYEGNIAQDIDALTAAGGRAGRPDAAARGLRCQHHRYCERCRPACHRRYCCGGPTCSKPSIRCASANANIGAARAAFFPTISLTANIGSASPALSGLFKSGSGTWTFSPQVTLPLFHGGEMRRQPSHRATANRDIALAQYEKAIQSGFREVADALALTLTLERQRAGAGGAGRGHRPRL